MVSAVVQVGPFVLIGLLRLSPLNYLLRFLRWARYLVLLDAPVPWRISLNIYFGYVTVK